MAGSKSNTFSNDFLLLVFNNTNVALVGDATGLRGSATDPGSLYISLHTASPEAGNQTTSEAAYGNYNRIAITRTAGNFAVAAGVCTLQNNVGDATWKASSGTATITHFGIGTDATGTGKLLYFGDLTPTIEVATNVTPELSSGSTIAED